MMVGCLNLDKAVYETEHPISNGLDISYEALRTLACKDILENLDGGLGITDKVGGFYCQAYIGQK